MATGFEPLAQVTPYITGKNNDFGDIFGAAYLTNPLPTDGRRKHETCTEAHDTAVKEQGGYSREGPRNTAKTNARKATYRSLGLQSRTLTLTRVRETDKKRGCAAFRL